MFRTIFLEGLKENYKNLASEILIYIEDLKISQKFKLNDEVSNYFNSEIGGASKNMTEIISNITDVELKSREISENLQSLKLNSEKTLDSSINSFSKLNDFLEILI